MNISGSQIELLQDHVLPIPGVNYQNVFCR